MGNESIDFSYLDSALGFIFISLHIFFVNLGVSFGFPPYPGKVSIVPLSLIFFTIDCTVDPRMSQRLEMVPYPSPNLWKFNIFCRTSTLCSLAFLRLIDAVVVLR